jgi:hypothetical protein
VDDDAVPRHAGGGVDHLEPGALRSGAGQGGDETLPGPMGDETRSGKGLGCGEGDPVVGPQRGGRARGETEDEEEPDSTNRESRIAYRTGAFSVSPHSSFLIN